MTAWQIVPLVLAGGGVFAAGREVGQRRWPAGPSPAPVRTDAAVDRLLWRIVIGLWLAGWALVGVAIAFSVASWPIQWAWFIWPASLATVIGGGGLWRSRRF